MSSAGPSPAGLPPVPPGWATQDRGTQIVAIFWTEAAVALIFVSTRLYSRTLIRALGLDDLMMVISMMAFIAVSGIITNIAALGGFRHILFIPLQNATEIALKNLIAQAVTIFAYGTSKFAIGYLILRLLPAGAPRKKYFIWVVISITLFYNWLQIILTFVQCKPYRGAWDMTVRSTCWTKSERLANIYVGGVYNIVVDTVLALFPVLLIWDLLLLSTRKKISLIVLLGLGLLAAICAIVKLTYVSSLFSTDETWATYNLDVWSGSELFVIIVCGSIPPSKPLWDRIFPKKRMTSDQSYLPPYVSPSKNYGHDGYEMMWHGKSMADAWGRGHVEGGRGSNDPMLGRT